MGKKYIIELERGTHIFILGPEGIVHIGEPDVVYNTVDGMQIGDVVINATPYTEPDLGQVRKKAYKIGYEKGYRDGVNRIGDAEDKIRKEAYQKGYETGYEDGYNEPGKNQQEAYQRGLNDAWDAARKISLAKIDGGFSWESMNNMFGTDSPSKIYKTFTVSEAIEKIRQHEQKQKEERIQVGDEVRNIKGGWIAVVSNIDGECMTLMDTNGALGDGYDVNRFTKTGRHFPEIAAVLEKMREES